MKKEREVITEDELIDLYRGTVRPLYAYVSYRAGSQRELTEDIVQETFMRALTQWRRKGKPREPLAWLKTVARNLLFSHYRRVNPKSLEESGIELEGKEWNPERRDEAELLYSGLARLGKRESRLLEAFYFEEKSVRELAEESGLSERGVEGRLRRARKKLEKQLRRMSSHGGNKK